LLGKDDEGKRQDASKRSRKKKEKGKVRESYFSNKAERKEQIAEREPNPLPHQSHRQLAKPATTTTISVST
jgi:hypothetical protein